MQTIKDRQEALFEKASELGFHVKEQRVGEYEFTHIHTGESEKIVSLNQAEMFLEGLKFAGRCACMTTERLNPSKKRVIKKVNKAWLDDEMPFRRP